jgi:serine/threonine protein kinase
LTEFEPQAFGRYYLVDKIAVGGMAEVFKAKSFSHGGFEKLQVIKRILQHHTDNAEFVEMFIDEAKISVELQNANIVQTYDFGKIRDNYYIAMECVEGKDVKAILRKLAERRKLLPPEFAASIAHEMCKGLDYAHKRTNARGEALGIVHRDISPSNILVSYAGEVKIADFGIAKAEISLYNTKDGVLKGKFEYMSPEQASGGDVSARSDIFAAGIILHEMLTGRRLFKTDNDIKTLEKIKAVDIQGPRVVNPHVPQRLDEVVMRALSRDPLDRYADAREMQTALADYLYPGSLDVTRESLAHFLQELFAGEIEAERDRLESGTKLAVQLYEQTPELDLDEDWEAPGPGSAGTLRTTPSRLPWLLVVGVLVALLGLAAGVALWLGMRAPEVVERVVQLEAPQPTHGSVQVVLKPAGVQAVFSVSGAEVGRGESLVYNLLPPSQDVVLHIEAEGYLPLDESINVDAGERLRLPLVLTPVPRARTEARDAAPTTAPTTTTTTTTTATATPRVDAAATAGELRFSSDPSGAEVIVDGRTIGRTPLKWTDGTAGGRHSVTYKLDGYDTTSFDVTFPERGSETARRTMARKAGEPGKVNVNVSGGWAEVWIDGRKVDTTPLYNHTLSVGSHTVRVVNAETGLDQTKTITVTSGEVVKVNF